ncbi:hypothetical protein [Vibrio sinaloensis]|uniref:Uncharacterized protein n=1 Tax=Photobacterium sp. (strain ATCC 43367) TaxID=379097 RepID=A0A0A5HTZ9_PHOS4|nr:hypothetical protein [Vibrio sinaloensis]KGY08992.1 hypothetical protein NM06_09125 [Vibrio sinaloensis]
MINSEVEKSPLSHKLSEAYTENDWLRAIVNLVPSVGGSLDIMISSTHNRLLQERISHLINELASDVSSLEDKVNNAIAESEEFHDLFILSLERTARISDRNRISAIANILSKCLNGIPAEDIHPVDLILVLTELSMHEAQVLSVIIGIFKHEKELLSGEYNTLVTHDVVTSKLPGIIQPQSDFLCGRLVGKGLLDEIFGNYSLTPAAVQLGKYLQIN